MAATATIPNLIESSPRDAAISSGTCGALVMGADYRALGVVRSLGRRGIPVWVINQGGHLVAAASRYVRRRLPWPAGDDRERVDFLHALCVKHQLDGWMLVPTDDYTVGLISSHHELLASKYRLTVPPWEKLRWACDKRLLHRLAEKLQVDQPWTACPSNRKELAQLRCPYPVIVKPAIRLRPSTLAVPKAWLVEDYDSLLTRYDEASALLSPENPMIQEIIPGGGETQLSYAALCRDGRPLASLVARRTRQFPRDFGQLSTYVETVDEPEVIEPAERLLAAIRFTGLAEVEFKRDPRSGQFKVIDINPRVWGWHTLSRRAGVDFPYLLWRLIRGESIPQSRGRAGARWVHWTADLRLAMEELAAGRLSLRDYLRSLRGPLESAIFSWEDPLPGILDLPLFVYAASKRVVQSMGSWPGKAARAAAG
jgi:D-aspartate ligase